MNFETLKLIRQNHIAEIRFNRPQAMNCFNQQMGQELAELTEALAIDADIRAVILRGEDPLFMAGGDIQFFQQQLSSMPAGVRSIIYNVNASIFNLHHMDKPVIAAVHGSVAGIGMGFMLACDLVVADASTKFTVAYPKLGITPDGGTSYFLAKHCGIKKAMEIALFSPILSAEEALHLGLINQSVEKEQVFELASQWAQKLSQGPTQVLGATKKLIWQSCDKPLSEHLLAEASSFAQFSAKPNFKIGVEAFLQKKKPDFGVV